jgi:hypothetical protein
LGFRWQGLGERSSLGFAGANRIPDQLVLAIEDKGQVNYEEDDDEWKAWAFS